MQPNAHPSHKLTLVVYIIGVILIAFVVTGVVLTFNLATSYLRNNEPVSSFTVTASSEKEFTAKKAKINFSLKEDLVDAQTNANLDKKSQEIKDYLIKMGIPSDKININKNSYADYRYQGNTDKPNQQQVVEALFEVTIEDTGKVSTGDLYAYLVSQSATNISRANFELGDREELCDDLKIEAIAKADELANRRLAVFLAKDVVRTEVLDSGDCNTNMAYPMITAVDAKVDSAAPGTPAPMDLQQTEKLKATVSLKIDYRN